MIKSIASCLLALSLVLASVPTYSATLVPPGNRYAKQPPIPGSSVSRTKTTRSSFEGKYFKIRNLIQRDRKLVAKIKKSASLFGIDPIHIVGALVGEHTYNVDAYDRLQNYYAKALAYLGEPLRFKAKGIHIADFVKKPQFSRCNQLNDKYELWTCREQVWNEKFRGKRVDGVTWPNYWFNHVFFQPAYAGQTFGLGQIGPLTALKVNDLVRKKVRREPKLSVKRAPKVYNRIMDPDSTLNYMAAILRKSIDAYRDIAGFDISKNPGVTATLYNLGNITIRARALAAKNRKRKAAGKKPLPPVENYYGWLINSKEADLRQLL